jgi:hypothetical protein
MVEANETKDKIIKKIYLNFAESRSKEFEDWRRAKIRLGGIWLSSLLLTSSQIKNKKLNRP